MDNCLNFLGLGADGTNIHFAHHSLITKNTFLALFFTCDPLNSTSKTNLDL